MRDSGAHTGDLCITQRDASRSPSNGGVQRGEAPLPGVWGCPPQAYRAGGWEELRPPGAVTQKSPSGGSADEGSDDMKCDRMRLNETVLKVSPLLATPNEATLATSRATLAQCVGVSVVPNEATVASFPASPLGVNGAKRAKLSHKLKFHPRDPRRSRADGNLASRPRVDDRECNEMQPNATELKVMPRLATRDEANQGHNQGRVAHRARVSGGPGSPPSPRSNAWLGRKSGQIGPNRATVWGVSTPGHS